jgi:PEP-CTERM motif
MSKLISIRKVVLASALSLGAMGASHAFEVESGGNMGGTTVVSFKMLSAGTGLFTLSLTDSLNVLVAPTGVSLSATTGTFSVVSPPDGTPGTTSVFYSMSAGEFALSFVSSFSGGNFTVNVSDNLTGVLVPLSVSTTVPEPESVALVLAGLGVAGMLGRRRLGHGKGYAVPTYTA